MTTEEALAGTISVPASAPRSGRVRCSLCGQFMAQAYGAPGGYACSQMTYSHYYGSWEHR